MDQPGQERERGAIRLFVDASLEPDALVLLQRAQAHYLRHVMRRAPGDRIRLFNGRQGEWEATIETIDQQRAGVRLGAKLAEQDSAPDLWLLFAPLKATRTRFVIEKATELGVGAIHPVLTRRSQTRRVNIDRLRAQAIEAAEQCGRREVPSVAEPRALEDMLAAWPPARRLLVCDPCGERSLAQVLAGTVGEPWAILVGPEGGFAPDERRILADHPAVVRAHLGLRILRGETASMAALACWQALAGDWRGDHA